MFDILTVAHHIDVAIILNLPFTLMSACTVHCPRELLEGKVYLGTTSASKIMCRYWKLVHGAGRHIGEPTVACTGPAEVLLKFSLIDLLPARAKRSHTGTLTMNDQNVVLSYYDGI